MFTYSYQERFQMNPLQSNILMNQIRAEKNIYSSRNSGPVIQSHRQQTEKTGKRIYHAYLYKPTLSPQKQSENDYTNNSKHRGRKMDIAPLVIGEQRSKSGRKFFEDICRHESTLSRQCQKSPKNRLRRFDHSPTNQNRTTICLKWN